MKAVFCAVAAALVSLVVLCASAPPAAAQFSTPDVPVAPGPTTASFSQPPDLNPGAEPVAVLLPGLLSNPLAGVSAAWLSAVRFPVVAQARPRQVREPRRGFPAGSALREARFARR